MNHAPASAAENESEERIHFPFRIVDVIACAVIFANVVNLFFARIGIVPDILLFGTAVPALLWTIQNGIRTHRIAAFLWISGSLVVLYVVYSSQQVSYVGFRNAAALVTVLSVFLFFYKASPYLCKNRTFLVFLLLPLGSFAFLWDVPFAVAKNNINGAMCYYLLAVTFCYPGLAAIRKRHVFLVFGLIFALSLFNGHRALAAASILLLCQFNVLSMSRSRRLIRPLMFIGLVATVVAVIMLVTDTSMAPVTAAFNEFVTSEGGRRLSSGRQILWPVVWDAIVANPLLGVGPGTVVADVYTTTLSAHNLYLQIGLQLGFVGLALLLGVFWSLWYAARPSGIRRLRHAENLLTVVITMIAIHSLFEVFLLQNALAVGVPAWMVLGLGLGYLDRYADGYASRFDSPSQAASMQGQRA